MGKERYTADHVIQAIRDTKGMVSLAAKRLRCDVDTVHNYAKRYPTVKKAIQEEREAMTDIAELSLYNCIQKGEGWAVCFYLKTQGKGRGYVERHEVEHSGRIEQVDVDAKYELIASRLARLATPGVYANGDSPAPQEAAYRNGDSGP